MIGIDGFGERRGPAVTRPAADREHGLVVFGATGFTGRLACEHLVRTYGCGAAGRVRWAVAGRSRERLEAMLAELAELTGVPAARQQPIIVCDAADPDAVGSLAASAAVVISTAGPYALYGTPVLEQCAFHGTHYCDITGEVQWVREMARRYDGVARGTGAKLVSFCGHDSIPWELTVAQLAKRLSARGGDGEGLARVRCWNEMRGSFSGGTLATVFHHATCSHPNSRGAGGVDPLAALPTGEKSPYRLRKANRLLLGREPDHGGRWAGLAVMGPTNGDVIRRGNALAGWGPALQYGEANIFRGFLAGLAQSMQLVVLGCAVALPPLGWLLRATALPKPGEGPAVEAMPRGFLQVTAEGTGDQGTVVRSKIYFPACPGYRETARMLVESGLVLLLEPDRAAVLGGTWTPAACMGDCLLERLVRTGTRFAVE